MDRSCFAGLSGRALALAVVSGALYGLGFCGWDQYVLAWFCLAPVMLVMAQPGRTPGAAAVLGWLTGAVAHLVVYAWLVGMLRSFAFLPWPLAVVVYVLICLGQSSLFAAWGWGTVWLCRRGVGFVWAAPAALVVVEWLYPALFPSYLANSQYRQLWLLQTLDLWGPLGISYLLALTAAVLATLAGWLGAGQRCPDWRPILVCLLLWGGSAFYGQMRMLDWADTLAHAPNPLRVGLVQANMGIYQKRQAPEEGLRRHRDQSLELEAQQVDLIVWPESAYLYALDDSMRDLRRFVSGPLKTPLLFGGLRLEPAAGGAHQYNSAFLLDAAGQLQGTYDKNVLLAFGEYLPMSRWLPFLRNLSPMSGQLTPGSHTKALTLAGIRYGTLICYEDILPGLVRRLMRSVPHLLVNLSNDSWYGRTHEPRIHLALASFRAIEQRRYLVRATNTGISAVIDPLGRVVAETPIFARANLVASVVPLTGTTLYQRLGDWVGLLALSLGLWQGRHALGAGLQRLRRAVGGWRRRAPGP